MVICLGRHDLRGTRLLSHLDGPFAIVLVDFRTAMLGDVIHLDAVSAACHDFLLGSCDDCCFDLFERSGI
jgi:hypothetical protein